MEKIREICEKETDLLEEEIRKLEEMYETLPYLANLSEDDIFIDCLRTAGDAVVVAEAKPENCPSSYKESVVGMIAKKENEPAVERTFRMGVATKHMKALTQENASVVQSVEPIQYKSRIIGVLIRERRIDGQMDEADRLHLSHEKYEYMAQAMISGKESWLAECIDEAVLIVDECGKVRSANEIARRLYQRLGYVGNIIGQSYENLRLTYPEFDTVKHSGAEVEVGNYILNVAHVRLRQKNLSYAVIIRDVTAARLKEKELVLKSVAIQEMHHRVKNNLQTIASLLRLQTRRTDNEEVKQVLEETMSRILSIAVTHELLAKEGVDQVRIGEVLRQIKSYVLQYFEKQNVNIEIQMPDGDFETDSDIATSVAMVVNELLQNCMKYAFTGKDTGKVQIIVKKGSLYSQITVKDDGSGFDASVVAGQKTNHLGWGIVRSLVKDKLHGSLEITSGMDGTVTTFDFLNRDIDIEI